MKTHEKFDETLIEELHELMVFCQNEKNDFYKWYAGHTDIEEIKRLFMIYYYNSTSENQKDYIKFLLKMVKDFKHEKEEKDRLIPIYKEILIKKYKEVDEDLDFFVVLDKKIRDSIMESVDTRIEKNAVSCAYNILVHEIRDRDLAKDLSEEPKYSVTGPIYDDDENPTYYIESRAFKESELRKKNIKF